jgi:hypothetical protein
MSVRAGASTLVVTVRAVKVRIREYQGEGERLRRIIATANDYICGGSACAMETP